MTPAEHYKTASTLLAEVSPGGRSYQDAAAAVARAHVHAILATASLAVAEAADAEWEHPEDVAIENGAFARLTDRIQNLIESAKRVPDISIPALTFIDMLAQLLADEDPVGLDALKAAIGQRGTNL